jgi:hypothetical protein
MGICSVTVLAGEWQNAPHNLMRWVILLKITHSIWLMNLYLEVRRVTHCCLWINFRWVMVLESDHWLHNLGKICEKWPKNSLQFCNNAWKKWRFIASYAHSSIEKPQTTLCFVGKFNLKDSQANFIYINNPMEKNCPSYTRNRLWQTLALQLSYQKDNYGNLFIPFRLCAIKVW